MKILIDEEIVKSISFLDEAWQQEETFFLFPRRTGLADEWVNEAIRKLPDELKYGCFGLLTSGSTGTPKIVIGSKKRAELLAQALHRIQKSEPIECAILSLPLSYSYSFINQYVWARVHERKLHVTSGFKDTPAFKNKLCQAESAMLCLVGPQVSMFEKYLPKHTFPGILRLHFAGGSFPQERMPRIQKIFPKAKIFNNYGCTEAMPRLTIRQLEDSEEGNNIGFPLPGITMKAEENGHIVFRSPYRSLAFFTSGAYKRIEDKQWLPSGDIGSKLEDGSWFISGRTNEVYKRYGEKISLPRLSNTVKQVWSKDVAFYRERDKSGEEGHVLVVAPALSPSKKKSILQAFRKNHSRTHWPLRVESIFTMPMLTNGKIDTNRLKNDKNKVIHWEQRV